MPLSALTIFCGAFLLFLVQPLMGKYLLPWFGGGPGVWTTCLLFFQALLLGGYAYAHFLQRLAPRRQALVHVALLVASLAFLPVIPGAGWKPTGAEDPVLRILLLLAATLGLPYLVLSATGPLLQRWSSLLHPGASPYRLYALSNAGSLLALVAYPFLLEPRFSRHAIAWGWSAGLGLFVALCAATAWRLHRAPIATPPPESASPGGDVRNTNITSESAPLENATVLETDVRNAHIRPEADPSGLDRLLWFVLPALASLLLVATTNKLCLDVAAIPFLWVLPLGVYLVSFILCFDHPRWYARGLFAALLAACCLVLAWFLSISAPPLWQLASALVATLFVACMVCHGELYRLRPAPGRLTGYYLAIAAGGAGGSLFVALLAPVLFDDYRELQLGLVLLLYFLGVLCWFHRNRPLALGLAAGTAAIPIGLPLLRADAGDAWYGWFLSAGREIAGFATHFWPAMAAGAVALLFALWRNWRRSDPWHPRLMAIPALLTGLLAVVFVQQARLANRGIQEAARNFYGAYKVFLNSPTPDPATHFLVLANGGVTHGLQFFREPQALWATSYYAETSGVGRAFQVLPEWPRHIGAVGLGAGTIATYGRAGDTFRFYEINPAVFGTACLTFTYLKHCRSDVSVALGDARLALERDLRRNPAQRFDLLVLDAFAGDAIPVHLLTREALQLYRQVLTPNGIIAVHISNRHLDLRPVVENLAVDAGLHFVTTHDTVEKKNWWLYSTDWVLLSADADLLNRPEIQGVTLSSSEPTQPGILWTDDHASLFSVLR